MEAPQSPRSVSSPAQEALQQRVLWSLGTTRDRTQASEAFLSSFVDDFSGFSRAALWLDPAPDGLSARRLTCVIPEREGDAVAETIDLDRSEVQHLVDNPFAVVDTGPDPFGRGSSSQTGRTVLYSVGTLGVFGLRWAKREELDDHRSFLTSISTLAMRFANVLRGCTRRRRSTGSTTAASASGAEPQVEEAALSALNADAAAPEAALAYFRSHDAPVLLIDPGSGKIRMANAAASRFYGYDRATLTQMHIQEINQLSDEEVQRRRAEAESEEKNVFDFPHRLANGEVKMVRVHSSPVQIPGEGRLLLSIIHNANDEFEARTALGRSQLKYRRLFEQTQDAIIVHGPDGVIREVNPRVTDVFGYTEEAVVGESIHTLHAPSARETVMSAMDEVRQDGSAHFEVECCRRDGTPFWADVSATTIQIGGETAVQCVVRDVTDRRRAQDKIRSMKDRYEQILEAMPIQLAIFDPEARYEFVTPSSISDPDRRRTIVGMTDVEYARMRGHDLDRAQNRMETIRRVARTQEPARLTETIPDDEGHTEHHVRFLSPVVVDGETTFVAGYGVEITDQKRIEQELREARDRARTSLRTKERLLEGLSHDIRTPLNAIVGLIQATFQHDPSREVAENLRSMRQSSEMLLALIEDLLTLSDLETDSFELNPSPFDLRAVVTEVLDMLSPQADRKGLKIHRHTASGFPPRVLGDALRVRQIVTNLVQNAIKYTEHGAVSVTLRHERRDGPSCSRIILEVADTGPGLPPDLKDRVFDRRQRGGDENNVDGMGLGLGVVRELVDQMEGTIEVASVPGQGSVFQVLLPFPVVETPPASRTEEPQLPDDVRVLVVDDTLMNREVAAELLTKWSLSVDTVENGDDALRQITEHDYDLLLIDLHMDGMDGYDTARRVRDRCEGRGPALVAYTASSTPSRWDEMRKAGFDDWVRKPHRPGALWQTITEQVGRVRSDTGTGRAPSPARQRTWGAAVPTSDAPARTYDLSFLEQNVEGDIEKYISMLVRQSRRLEEVVQDARKEETWDDVQSVVHEMKSSARLVKAGALLDALRRVEDETPPPDASLSTLLRRNRELRQALPDCGA